MDSETSGEEPPKPDDRSEDRKKWKPFGFWNSGQLFLRVNGKIVELKHEWVEPDGRRKNRTILGCYGYDREKQATDHARMLIKQEKNSRKSP